MHEGNERRPSRHPMDLSGKVALVTGGNRGIGLGIAKGLAAAGCDVAVWGRSAEQNRLAQAECAGLPGMVAAFACDVLDGDAVRAALDSTLGRFGRIDGIFANAGMGGGDRTPFVEQATKDWQRMLDLNVLGVQRVTSAVLGHMVRQVQEGRATGGRVVLTSSAAARVGVAFNQHYAASKAALVAMARGIAVEFGRHRITANALLPGYFETEMIGDLVGNQKFNDKLFPHLAIRRYGDPMELAGLANYLMSDSSAYHTGDAITVDGGFTIS